MKNDKGITIIATIITVLVLLLIAGITVTALTKGPFDKAKDTVKTQQEREGNITQQETAIFEDVAKKPGNKMAAQGFDD